jgi:hypothetical protein
MTAYLWVQLVMLVLGLMAVARLKPGHVNTPWTASQLVIVTVSRLALLVWTVMLLTGCGGGDAEPVDVPTPRVDCARLPAECL